MIYLIYGQERYLSREKVSQVLSKHQGACVEKLESPSPEQLIELMNIPSLFAPQRVLLVNGFDLSGDRETLVSALSSLPPGVTMVFKDPEGLDKRSKLFKTINSLGEVHEFKPLAEWDEGEAVSFVVNMFSRNGKKISAGDARFLIENAGRDLSLLNSEIEKISTYMGEKGEVHPEDIEAVMTRAGWDRFTLMNDLLKKSPQAMTSMLRLLRDDEEPVPLLGFIASQYRLLFKIKLLASRGEKPPQIARVLKSSPYYINRMYAVSDKFKLAELKNALLLMYETDLKIKSGWSCGVELPLLVSNLVKNA